MNSQIDVGPREQYLVASNGSAGAEEERRTKVVVRGGWGASTWLKSLSPFGRVAKDEENDDVERQ
jgi:hypothetical protein